MVAGPCRLKDLTQKLPFSSLKLKKILSSRRGNEAREEACNVQTKLQMLCLNIKQKNKYFGALAALVSREERRKSAVEKRRTRSERLRKGTSHFPLSHSHSWI